MKGNDDVLTILNEVLTAELTAINQYFIHAKMCDNWGYQRLAEHIRDESIDEMKHAERIDRADPVPRGRAQPAAPGPAEGRRDGARAVPQRPRASRSKRVERLQPRHRPRRREDRQRHPRACSTDILVGEEEHVDWLETQLEMIGQIGVEHYLAQQLHD